MRHTLLLTAPFVFLLHTQLMHCAPPYNARRIQLNPEYMRAITAYRRLEQRLPRAELHALTTIGILNGARQAEEQMETHLIDVIKDLLQNTNTQDATQIMPKIDEIEKQLARDERALQILTSAMDLATSVKDERAFKQEMRETMRQVAKREQKNDNLKDHEIRGNSVEELAPRIAALREHITKQFAAMKSLVDEKITHTLDHLIEEADQDALLKKASEKVLRKRNVNIDRIDSDHNVEKQRDVNEEPAEVRVIKSILSEADFQQNLVDEQAGKQQQNKQEQQPQEKQLEKLVDVKQQLKRQQKRQENKRQDNNKNNSNNNHKGNKRQDKKKGKQGGKDKKKENRTEQRKEKPQQGKQKQDKEQQAKDQNKKQHKEKRQDLIPIPINVDENYDDSFALEFDINNTAGPQLDDEVAVLAIEEDDDEPDDEVAVLAIEEDNDEPDDGVALLAIEEDNDDEDDDEEPRIDDDEASPELEMGGAGGLAGGGLVGIITSLSGGEGGSDIGALIGALTGVVSTLFGPGGLDIESLISTGTSLISGLLAGNKNFGTVLGQYVGTAFDGLSGGGGAINNGQFLGNFLGTVVASLSADPEDEAGPQPLLFAQTLLGTFLEAKNRKSSEEVSEERKGSSEVSKKKKESPGAGSDSGSFVKQIVAHIVSNLVSVVLNASLGASGGASHASASLFTGSSSASHQKSSSSGHHGRAWT